ncbi:MAG: FAD-dependent oxidoreductase [Pseudomonadota bacterium]
MATPLAASDHQASPAASTAPRVLVLGGGFAGMFAAKALQRRLRRSAAVELVNAVNYFVFQPLLPEVAAGGVTTRDAVAPLRQLLPGVRVRQAQIHGVDADAKTVTVFQGLQRRPTVLPYDHLVIALGQDTDLSAVPGLDAHALQMKTLADAHRLRNHVIDKLEHADITALPEVKRELLTFVVIGGGFSGVETIGEMRELIDRSLSYYPNVDRSEIRLLLIEYADRILAEMPESLAAYTVKSFARRDVEVRTGVGVREATGTQIVTTEGEVIGARTVVATIGAAPAALLRRMDLPTAAGGRIQVRRDLRVAGREDVWAIGDNALIPMVDAPEDRTDFAPPTAQFAVREATQLADNLAATLQGEATAPFEYKSRGAMASLGSMRGVAHVFGVKVKGFPAWVLWRTYYLGFMPGFATKIRVAMGWALDWIIGRSTVQAGVSARQTTRYVRYRAGDRVFEVGNRSNGFYIVVEGAFELRDTDPETGEPRTRRVEAGGHFGERSLLGAGLRAADARAVEDAVALVVEAEDFRRLVDHLPIMQGYFTAYAKAKGFDAPRTAEDRGPASKQELPAERKDAEADSQAAAEAPPAA